jgi:putative glutamine amidotransferase
MATAVPDSYLRALLQVDGIPLIIPVIQPDRVLEVLFGMLDGLLLIGGPDLDPVHFHQTPLPGLRKVTPARDAVELQVTRWALEVDLPILAICRGVQVLNVAAGGTLWQDIATQIPKADKHDYHPNFPEDYRAHTIKTIPRSRIAGIVGEDDVLVNSLHHQAIDRLGHGLRATAFAPDGIIEAIEGEGTGWVVGVQWHPEWLIESSNRMRALFETFRNVCAVGDQPAMQSA